MVKAWLAATIIALGMFLVDQNIKFFFVDGLRLYTHCIDLILVYNHGVAFSLFAFLGDNLKWIQLALIGGVIGYAVWFKEECYFTPMAIMIGAALSNLSDRFIYGGVVDYVYWHCGFNFAVFNAADVMIDIAVVWLLILTLKPKFCSELSDI